MLRDILGLTLLTMVAGTAAPSAAQAPDLDLTAGAPVLVVPGEGLEAQGRRLAALLKETTGREAEVQPAGALIEPGTWRLSETAMGRPLVLLGNVADNPAMFALFTHWLEGANAAYPGPGRYVLRTLFEPLRRGKNVLCLGASDAAGIDAGLVRLGELLRAGGGKLPPTIELGSDAGPDKPRTVVPADFAAAATEFFWKGTPPAGAKSRQLLLEEMGKRDKGLWGFDQAGHYDWERAYRPLLQLLASGVLTEEERRRVDERLVTCSVETTDWAYLGYANAPVTEAAARLERHQLSALVAAFPVLEYLHYVGRVPEERRDAVRRHYERFVGHAKSLVEGGYFCPQTTGNEGGDCLSMLADLYLMYGDRRVVADGTLRRLADCYYGEKDNLGWHACDDSYIGARPGCHFARSSGGISWLYAGFLTGDGRYRWLLENAHTFLSHFQVSRPPEVTSLLAHLPAAEPKERLGLTVDPLDPYWYQQCATRAADETAVPVTAPIERCFGRATFRDGFTPDDAYLLFQGTDRGSVNSNYSFMANSITRYTELGSLLLYANSQRHSGWSQSLVSASRGRLDPQSTACTVEAVLNAGGVSGMQSCHERHGGMRWVRSILRRRDAYFVVLDRLTASEADTYLMVCRWRSFHPGAMVGPTAFEAVDGMSQVRFHLASAAPAAWKVETEKRDGSARPTMVRQVLRRQLPAGGAATFANIFYATDEKHPRRFATRALSETAVLVRGRSGGAEELSAAGVERVGLPGVEGDARLWVASSEEVALSGIARCRLAGKVTLSSDREFSLGLAPGAPGWIEGPAEGETTLQVEGDGVTLDGKPIAGRVALTRGRHALRVAGSDALLAGLKAALEKAWSDAKPAAALTSPSLETTGKAELAPAWEGAGVPPAPSDHGNVRMWADPPAQIGEVATWRNRLINPPYGYGWHGSERAGWQKGTQGTMVMDLGAETEIADLQLVRSRRAFTEVGAFNPGEFEFDLVLSNDNFRKDLRRLTVKDPAFGTYYRENSLYTYTVRFPMFTVPVGARARYVRLTPRRVLDVKSPPADYYGTYTDDEISFMGVFVRRADPEPRREALLQAVDLGAGPALLYQADTTLRLVSPAGKMLWEKTLDAPPAARTQIADVDGDGRPEVLVFTLAETLTAYRADGSVVYRVDVNEKLDTDQHPRGTRPYRPCAFAAWRPDAAGRREVWFFPHYNCIRVDPGPEHTCSPVEQPDHRRGGKFAFTVPDVTGDGREELAIVGLYGSQFGVVASDAEAGKVPFAYHAGGPLKGYSSGNMEMELYWSGGVVRDGGGKWLGVFALNPGGINFYGAPDFKEQWSHFHHPQNSACVQADLDGDGTPEILVGREDGTVLAYAAKDGATVARVALDGAVRALAWTGEYVAAGTEQGLVLLDRRLTPLARRPGPVEAVAVVPGAGGAPLVAAVLSNGKLVGLRPAAR